MYLSFRFLKRLRTLKLLVNLEVEFLRNKLGLGDLLVYGGPVEGEAGHLSKYVAVHSKVTTTAASTPSTLLTPTPCNNHSMKILIRI